MADKSKVGADDEEEVPPGRLKSSTLKKSKKKSQGKKESGGGESTSDYVTKCGPLTVLGNFDSGNFLRAELVQRSPSQESLDEDQGHSVLLDGCNDESIVIREVSKALMRVSSRHKQQRPDYELNIWTRPDCYGTPFENGNRTWFYFGIKGGNPQSTVKINIINLNKQTKLFLQGMAPVYKIVPDKPAWERIRDKVVLIENKSTDNGCSISFRQRLPDNPHKSTLYIAFTYPFSYLESCDLLKKMDMKFNPRSKSTPSPMSLHVSSRFPKVASNKDLKALKTSPEDEVYYHRECVCYSLEGKRVDLLTISAYNGISGEREERLANLFPIQDEFRSFKFPNKKVIFLSARVHPGETPSSFVLNGFIKFVLDKTDPRAILLRRYFVFKIIPILNPDGVYKGHYRTDPRGVNLNRMYLNPSVALHPSIYAARKLLMFYHCGIDAPDPPSDDQPEFPVENAVPSSSSQEDLRFGENVGPSSPRKKGRSKKLGSSPQRHNMNTSASSSDGEADVSMIVEDGQNAMLGASDDVEVEKKPYKFVLNDANSLCAGCVPFDDENAVLGPPSCSSSAGCIVSCGETTQENAPDSALNKSLHQCAFEACDEDSVLYENMKAATEVISNPMEVDPQTMDEDAAMCFPSASTSSENAEKKVAGRSSARKKKRSTAKPKDSKRKIGANSVAGENLEDVEKPKGPRAILTRQKSLPLSLSKHQSAPQLRSTRRNSGSVWYRTSGRYNDNSSGLFLYIDMHGHTTKRGIFMYGNHFSDINTQAECMLVPRLMAINSPHFDFAACNFTERLMCVKDRRDGASREGSGRVACLKLTGLIRSYTLECNYNTGRIINPVIERPTSLGFADPFTPSYTPPNYTIDLFEGVGKALGESILDMTGQNPFSRLTHTEFRSLEGVKRSLIARLKMSPEYGAGAVPDKTSSKKATGSGSLSQSNHDSNPLLPQIPSGHKVKKQPKSKVLLPSQSAGPLGPRRENQNNSYLLPSSTSAIIKASGSHLLKKLPPSESSEAPIAGTSTAYKPIADKNASSRPKTSVGKVMKKRSFPKFTAKKKTGSVKTKKKTQEDKSSDLSNNNEQSIIASSSSTIQ